MMKHTGKWALITAICLCGSLTACQNSQTSDVDVQFDAKDTRSDGVKVAKVSGTFIYQSDVRRAAIAQGLIPSETEIAPTASVFKAVLEELIDQRLLALDAKAKAIDSCP